MSSTLALMRARGVEHVKVGVKHTGYDEDDDFYYVFAPAGPEFDKLVRFITKGR